MFLTVTSFHKLITENDFYKIREFLADRTNGQVTYVALSREIKLDLYTSLLYRLYSHIRQ